MKASLIKSQSVKCYVNKPPKAARAGCSQVFSCSNRKGILYPVVRKHWKYRHSLEPECENKDKVEILMTRDMECKKFTNDDILAAIEECKSGLSIKNTILSLFLQNYFKGSLFSKPVKSTEYPPGPSLTS